VAAGDRSDAKREFTIVDPGGHDVTFGRSIER
jgi:hypothetical protein